MSRSLTTLGNANALGPHKGKPGRKSAYQERQDREELWKIWNKHYPKDYPFMIQNKEKRSPKEVWIAKLLIGDQAALHDLFTKLYPDEWKDEGKMKFEGVFEFVVIPTLPRGMEPRVIDAELISQKLLTNENSIDGKTAELL